MAERAGLLNRCTGLNLYRGFESLPLRKTKIVLPPANGGGQFLFCARAKLALQREQNKNCQGADAPQYYFRFDTPNGIIPKDKRADAGAPAPVVMMHLSG